MKTFKRFTVEFLDSGREPQCPPNPAFPAGIDLNMTQGRLPSCHLKLPYPASRCGLYVVVCTECDLKVVLTVAGRSDDPRSLRVACKKKPH